MRQISAVTVQVVLDNGWQLFGEAQQLCDHANSTLTLACEGVLIEKPSSGWGVYVECKIISG